MVVAAGSQEPAPLEPVHCTSKASPSAGSPDRPSLHLRERSSSMKNRKREICTSGTVRDEDGNILIYSDDGLTTRRGGRPPKSAKAQIAVGAAPGGAAGSMGIACRRCGRHRVERRPPAWQNASTTFAFRHKCCTRGDLMFSACVISNSCAWRKWHIRQPLRD